MALNLRPTINPRERILSFGGPGTGKSTDILSVARRCPSDTFYVRDSDPGSYERLLATDFSDLDNVEVLNLDMTSAEGWEEFFTDTRKLVQNMGRDDWWVVDLSTALWDGVQAWFVEKVHGEDIDAWFIAARMAKDDKKGGFAALKGSDGDWQVINKQIFKVYSWMRNMPGHVYWAAEAAKLDKEDEKETKAIFGPHGYKPKGQKRMGHVPDTVILKSVTNTGWEMTTVKDRGRENMDAVVVGDFARDYLMKVAGWGVKSSG